MSGREFAADIVINKDDLSAEMVKQGTLMAYWNEILFQADLAYRNAKIKFDHYEAEQYLLIRQKAVAGGVKPTEAGIEREMRRLAGWQEQKRELNRRELEIGRIKGQLTALIHKKEMLVALAHGQRAEMRSLGLAA